MERANYYVENIKFDRNALAEVWEILKNYEDGIDKIPNEYIWLIEDNMNKNYIVVLNNASNLKDDTKKIITFLYTKFLASNEEKTVLEQLAKLQYNKKIEKTQSKMQYEENRNTYQNFANVNISKTQRPIVYNPNISNTQNWQINNNYIKNNKTNETNSYLPNNRTNKINSYISNDKPNETQENLPIKYKKSWIRNLIDKITNFFKKKH